MPQCDVAVQSSRVFRSWESEDFLRCILVSLARFTCSHRFHLLSLCFSLAYFREACTLHICRILCTLYFSAYIFPHAFFRIHLLYVSRIFHVDITSCGSSDIFSPSLQVSYAVSVAPLLLQVLAYSCHRDVT